MGALLGDDVVYAEAGDFVFKPRDQWHTFWNAGDEPCRILEIIAPGGFEHMFREMGELTSEPDPAGLGGLQRAATGSSSTRRAPRGSPSASGWCRTTSRTKPPTAA